VITVEFNRFRTRPGYRILDIGCGSGRHTCAAFQLEDVFAIGIDVNSQDLAEAKERLKLHENLDEHGGGRWALSCASALALPFKPDSFDLIICSEVLEHVPEDHLVIEEIIRVLKPGGNLAVSVPRYWPEKICWWLSKEYAATLGGHIRIYKPKHLIDRIEKTGFKKWALHYAHSLHTPFWWLKCLLGPSREDSVSVNLYHRLLTWDIMKHPSITRFLDRLLNPLLGKSVVIYFRKEL
jgi:ubiquinone/menaquinone biosynthesis C-methylase UbiE